MLPGIWAPQSVIVGGSIYLESHATHENAVESAKELLNSTSCWQSTDPACFYFGRTPPPLPVQLEADIAAIALQAVAELAVEGGEHRGV